MGVLRNYFSQKLQTQERCLDMLILVQLLWILIKAVGKESAYASFFKSGLKIHKSFNMHCYGERKQVPNSNTCILLTSSNNFVASSISPNASTFKSITKSHIQNEVKINMSWYTTRKHEIMVTIHAQATKVTDQQ